MFAVALAIGLLTNPCPMEVGIAPDGTMFSARMQGWYRTSQKTLARDLQGGCYNDAQPSPVTSVTLEIAPGAPREKVAQVLSVLEKAGWPKLRTKVKTWTNYPREPLSR